MNLLLISRCPPFPLHLGDRLIPYHLVEQLSRRHTVDLIAFYSLPEDLRQVEEYSHLFRSIRLVREPRRSLISYLWRLANQHSMYPARADQSWSPEMWDAIDGQLNDHHYDLVQLFGGVQVYEYRELVRHLPNLIVPYEAYSLFLERLLTQQVQPWQRAAVWLQLQVARAYERRMYVEYDGVVVLSETDAETLNMLQPTLPLHVIPNGIDTEYFKPSGSATPEPSTLLFVGNYEYAPNVDAALHLVHEIFPLVQEAIPQARLCLVGNAPPASLSALANSHIEVTGRVPDVRPYLERATLVISPLRLGAGIKNKILEAMAMAKPMVATPLSCEGIGLVEGAHLLFGTSSAELAAAAIRLIKSDELRRSMGIANRQLIERSYTWQHVAERYEALYAGIIAAHHSSS